MDMPWAVVALVGYKNISASSDLTHSSINYYH